MLIKTANKIRLVDLHASGCSHRDFVLRAIACWIFLPDVYAC
ncbi:MULTISPECIES: hypothetical protein [Cyanophyceae]|nr:hypothetical protein [Trichocoleus sp. FACHB-40]